MAMMNKYFCLWASGCLVNVNHTWYGIRWHWQSSPLFDTIRMHRKHNTMHYYGVTVLGLSVYFYIDQKSYGKEENYHG
jgi:hypothetical protein